MSGGGGGGSLGGFGSGLVACGMAFVSCGGWFVTWVDQVVSHSLVMCNMVVIWHTGWLIYHCGLCLVISGTFSLLIYHCGLSLVVSGMFSLLIYHCGLSLVISSTFSLFIYHCGLSLVISGTTFGTYTISGHTPLIPDTTLTRKRGVVVHLPNSYIGRVVSTLHPSCVLHHSIE